MVRLALRMSGAAPSGCPGSRGNVVGAVLASLEGYLAIVLQMHNPRPSQCRYAENAYVSLT
ncbi:hypothetical protein AKJ29_07450 [Aliiroseovarius crassostreae]|uniref:Uncharacterized protein n=1 Tax=Aliiroseovarius crassostreae TaxID=154981 RepID=A0A0N8IB48_9RHOB|nr:hypothetical protein AKJ29_07450 [Aliiroseovarius crassostreae]